MIICTATTQRIKEIDGQLKQLAVKLVDKPFDIDTVLEVCAVCLVVKQIIGTLKQGASVIMPNTQHIIEPVLLPKAKGKLFIIGGHEDKEDDMDILTNFTEAAGGHNAHIVVIATASQVPEEIDQMYQPVFEKLGVKSYNFLALQSRAEASEAQSVDTVCRATGIILSGGTQLRLTTLLGVLPSARRSKNATSRGQHLPAPALALRYSAIPSSYAAPVVSSQSGK